MRLQAQNSVLANISNEIISELTGDKLPSKSQVLQLLFHKTKNENVDVNRAVKLVIREVKTVWDKASVNTRRDCNCYEKLKKLHKAVRYFQKFHERTNKNKEAFVNQLNDVFDISHNSLIESISESEKNTLLSQPVDDIRSNLIRMKHHELPDLNKEIFTTEKDAEIFDKTESLELGEPEAEVPQPSASINKDTLIQITGEHQKSTQEQLNTGSRSQSS